jgi:hypothetical protein
LEGSIPRHQNSTAKNKTMCAANTRQRQRLNANAIRAAAPTAAHIPTNPNFNTALCGPE